MEYKKTKGDLKAEEITRMLSDGTYQELLKDLIGAANMNGDRQRAIFYSKMLVRIKRMWEVVSE